MECRRQDAFFSPNWRGLAPFLACFPLSIPPADVPPAPRHPIRIPPSFHVREAVFMFFNADIPPAIVRPQGAPFTCHSSLRGQRSSGSAAELHPQLLRYFRGCGILPRQRGEMSRPKGAPQTRLSSLRSCFPCQFANRVGENGNQTGMTNAP